MKVAKWGDSLTVRLPAVVVEALRLKEGDEIEIHVADTRELGIARKPGRQELLRPLRTFRGRLPLSFGVLLRVCECFQSRVAQVHALPDRGRQKRGDYSARGPLMVMSGRVGRV